MYKKEWVKAIIRKLSKITLSEKEVQELYDSLSKDAEK